MDKRWMAMVMGALLVGILVGGVLWARPEQSAQAADATRRLTVPAASFHPTTDYYNYANSGHVLGVTSGFGVFTAPVVFPCLPSVTVERIIVSVEDQNSGSDACVNLYRTKPNKGNMNVKEMANLCSSGSQPGVINYTDDTIDYPVVWPSHGAYLYLSLNGTNIKVYGVQIEYKRNI